MEDYKIDRDKLYALEIMSELEDLYISKIMEDENARQKIEPLRKCINFIRESYEIDDKAEYLYSQYVKAIRYNIIYSDIIDQMENNEQEK